MMQPFGVVPTIQDGDLTLFGNCPATHFIWDQFNLSPSFILVVYIHPWYGDLNKRCVSLVMSNRVKSHSQVFGPKVQGAGHKSLGKYPVWRSPGLSMVWGGRAVVQSPCFDHSFSNPGRPNEGRQHRRSSSGDEYREAGKSVGYLRRKVIKEQVLGRWFLQLGRPPTSAPYSLPRQRLRKGWSHIFQEACECMVGGHFQSPYLAESCSKYEILRVKILYVYLCMHGRQ